MRLTAEQVWRVCGVDRRVCSRVLEDLVHRQFLRVGPDGRYLRAADGAPIGNRQNGLGRLPHCGVVARELEVNWTASFGSFSAY
jgi:hypothetical protein